MYNNKHSVQKQAIQEVFVDHLDDRSLARTIGT